MQRPAGPIYVIMKGELKKCDVCGIEFVKKLPHHKRCSTKCTYDLKNYNIAVKRGAISNIEDLDGEIWIDIEGFEDYMISNEGRIKSRINVKANPLFPPYILMTPAKRSGGYLGVDLWNKGVMKKKLIHRLVAEAFIPNPNNKPEANHLFGEKWDNRASVLEWATKSENIRHSFDVLGRDIVNRIATKEMVFFTLQNKHLSSRVIGERFGVQPSVIKRIKAVNKIKLSSI